MQLSFQSPPESHEGDNAKTPELNYQAALWSSCFSSQYVTFALTMAPFVQSGHGLLAQVLPGEKAAHVRTASSACGSTALRVFKHTQWLAGEAPVASRVVLAGPRH